MPSRHTIACTLGILAAAAVGLTPTGAKPPGGAIYEIEESTVDCGGSGGSEGTWFELQGTIGQPDAHAMLAGAVYEISGGFWANGVVPCAWDFNSDGSVAITDLLDLLADWAAPWNINDLLDLLSAWGPC